MNRTQVKNFTHNQGSRLTFKYPPYLKEVRDFTLGALKKDLGQEGDLTTQAVLGRENPKVKAVIRTKAEGILAGLLETEWFLTQMGLSLKTKKKDGNKVKKGEKILEIEGGAKDILKSERTILNLLGRMSGIATSTQKVLSRVRKINPQILITPTRKTLWGLLDKRAVFLGGGGTHRLGLNDAFLVKDNHLALFKGNVPRMMKNIVKNLGREKLKGRFLEIEGQSLEKASLIALELRKWQKLGKLKIPCVLMLDNASSDQIKKIIKTLKTRKLWNSLLFEASGGINEKNLEKYARTGVDIISMGSLTHSVKALDLSLSLSA